MRSEMKLYADSAAAERSTRPYPRRARSRAAPEFPGCRPITIKREDLDTYDGRFEYWDGDTETAWMVCEPTTDTHERPSQRLAALGALIAAARGSYIECFGAMDLVLRGEGGERRRILQADQSVYLHPGRARLPEGAGMVVEEHDFPDVVVEVDHTTDVRRGKLGLYEEWGFLEVWVEVPERESRSRPAGRRSGLVIHVLEGGRYRVAPVSRAFPGWTAAEIHTAMNEPELSEATGRVLDRVGRALGAREGIGPDDTPWLRRQRRESRAEGERALLVRQAARRFGAGTAERLSALLPRIDDPDRLAEVADWIVDCATGADLLERVEAFDSRA